MLLNAFHKLMRTGCCGLGDAGFGDRLLSEVRKLSPKDARIRISAPQERLYSTWMGGSILASLDTFKRMWVSRKEFDEEGVRVIHRKTF